MQSSEVTAVRVILLFEGKRKFCCAFDVWGTMLTLNYQSVPDLINVIFGESICISCRHTCQRFGFLSHIETKIKFSTSRRLRDCCIQGPIFRWALG